MPTSLVGWRFQHHPIQSRRVRSLPSNRLVFGTDASRGEALYTNYVWHAFERTKEQSMEDAWNFTHIREIIQAWRRPDYNEIRSYSIPVSESFQIAAREYPAIKIDPDIMGGAPCVAGTRIPVYMILDAVEYYGSPEAVVKSYPNLTPEQVKDAIGFAKIVVECPLGDDEP